MQLFLFKVALRLMAMKRGSLKVIFLGLLVRVYLWIFKITFDVDICLPNNKIFIHLQFKSKFWKSSHMYDWFVKWFHELIFIESTNFFYAISFVMFFLEVEFSKYSKKCRYISSSGSFPEMIKNITITAQRTLFQLKGRLAAFQILEKRTSRFAVSFFLYPEHDKPLKDFLLGRHTAWTVNDVLVDPYPLFVLVDPYPFNAVERVLLLMDRPKQKRVWFDQDVIDSPHCMYQKC